MFLSVSIPIYNAEKYLEQSIESVLSQSMNDYEIILVDDGSKDRSIEICRKWQKKYPQTIRVIEKENTGSLLTRRRCMQESKGDYIYIMDADDYLVDSDMFLKIKNTIDESRADICFFNYKTEKGNVKNFEFENREIFERENLGRLYEIVIKSDKFNSLWDKVFKRNLVDWNEDYSIYKQITNGTDCFQMIPIVSSAKKIIYLDEVFYFYRTENNEASIVHKFCPTVYLSLKEIHKRLIEFSGEWEKYLPNLDVQLKTKWMTNVSTAAYKVRLMPEKNKKTIEEYLKGIGEDQFFRENYNLKEINLKRKVIVFLLYHRMYGLLGNLLKILR